jgi:hypothetical protein
VVDETMKISEKQVCFLLLTGFDETMKISGEAGLLSFAYRFW